MDLTRIMESAVGQLVAIAIVLTVYMLGQGVKAMLELNRIRLERKWKGCAKG